MEPVMFVLSGVNEHCQWGVWLLSGCDDIIEESHIVGFAVDSTCRNSAPSPGHAQKHIGLQVKFPVLPDLKQNWNVLKNLTKFPNITVYENPFSGSGVVICRQMDRKADKHSKANRHIFASFSYKHVNKAEKFYMICMIPKDLACNKVVSHYLNFIIVIILPCLRPRGLLQSHARICWVFPYILSIWLVLDS
jgi:hypothetical protein